MKAFCLGCLLLGVLGITACQPTGGKKPSEFPYFIQNDEIVLHKSHIMAVKTNLYQPSFGLSGIILPKHQANITAPHDGTLMMAAKANQLVQKNDTIALLTPLQTSPTQGATNTQGSPADNPTNSTSDTKRAHDKSNQDDTDTVNADNNSAADGRADNSNNDGSTDDNAHGDAAKAHSSHTSPKALIPKQIQPEQTQPEQNKPTAPPTQIKSPITGHVFEIYHTDGAQIHKDNAIALIGNTELFEFATTLPSSFERYLTIGQTVQFTNTPTQAPTTRLGELSELHNTSFAGQITDIRPVGADIAVTVQIKSNDNSLHKGMQLVGQVDYGQLAVGVVVPQHAIADGANLKELSRPPYKPLRPIAAKVWVIEQDGRLHLTEVSVVEYDPTTKNYLIVGVSQTSLIVTANLPPTAHNLPVVIR